MDDWVFLKVSSMKGVMRYEMKGKLSTRYVGPYKILKRVDKVAFELELPTKLVAAQQVFHISLLKKCVDDLVSNLTLEREAVKYCPFYEDVPVRFLTVS